jgi:Flp pilus assembly protein TadG
MFNSVVIPTSALHGAKTTVELDSGDSFAVAEMSQDNTTNEVSKFSVLDKLYASVCCSVGRRHSKDRVRAFGRQQRGAVAVEFALVAPTFILLMCIIIDTGLFLYAQGVLDYALRSATRAIQTGSSTVTASTFDNILCATAAPLIPCSLISYSVTSTTTINGFSILTPQTPNNSGFLNDTFTPGTATNLVLAQAAYSRQYLFPWLASIAGGTGTPALVSTLAFQNEAYYTP